MDTRWDIIGTNLIVSKVKLLQLMRMRNCLHCIVKWDCQYFWSETNRLCSLLTKFAEPYILCSQQETSRYLEYCTQKIILPYLSNLSMFVEYETFCLTWNMRQQLMCHVNKNCLYYSRKLPISFKLKCNVNNLLFSLDRRCFFNLQQ